MKLELPVYISLSIFLLFPMMALLLDTVISLPPGMVISPTIRYVVSDTRTDGRSDGCSTLTTLDVGVLGLILLSNWVIVWLARNDPSRPFR